MVKLSEIKQKLGEGNKFLLFGVVGVVAGLSLYGLYASKSTQNNTSSSGKNNSANKKYLEIKEEGIKLELSEAISDAYYIVGASGQIAFGLRSLDEKEEFVDCKPHTIAAVGAKENIAGIAALSTDKYNSERSKTEKPERSGFKDLDNAVRVGDNYYLVQTDYDCQSQDPNSQPTIKKAQQAFRDASKTIIKL